MAALPAECAKRGRTGNTTTDRALSHDDCVLGPIHLASIILRNAPSQSLPLSAVPEMAPDISNTLSSQDWNYSQTCTSPFSAELSVQNIRCPDGNYCKDGQTCCLLTSGQYGCCPYAHAQCCSDHASCCPEGYTCKVSTHQCLHAATNHTMPMVQKVQPVLLSSATPEVTGKTSLWLQLRVIFAMHLVHYYMV